MVATFLNYTPDLSYEQRIQWLRLWRTDRVGPIAFRELLNRFGSAEAALDALPGLRGSKTGKPFAVCTAEEARKELEICAEQGITLAALGEQAYPPLLRFVADPPPLLAIKGNSGLWQKQAVAIVGSRNASIAGRKLSKQFAAELGQHDVIVVSGLARGIDTEAHTGALKAGTIAVVAGGHSTVYPRENEQLAAEIIENGGAIVSEMPYFHEPRAKDFPRRNRIISGISKAILVVEASKRSGSLITARLAAEQNRDVFAIPGSPLDPRSEGTNQLIRNGATLAQSAKELVEDMNALRQPQLSFRAPEDEPYWSEEDDETLVPFNDITPDDRQIVLSQLTTAPVLVDDIAEFSGQSIQSVSATIVLLELEGLVERHSGGRISLAE